MKLLPLSVSIALLLLALFREGSAQSPNPSAEIDQIFQKFYEYTAFQGVVLVADRGEVVYQHAFGQANREWSVPNTLDTRFNIASVSKQFTAVLILRLVEAGLLDLDRTISDYLPEYRSDVGRRVTLHHLLTHQSGIPNYTSLPYVWSDSLTQRYPTETLIRRFGSLDLEFEPGTRYRYSNTGYLLLGAIAERVTGEPFDVLLSQRVLLPLGLHNTAVDDRNALVDKRAFGYEKTTQGYRPVAGMYMKNLQGAGNLYSTVEDLFRWDQAWYTHDVLSKKEMKTLEKSYTETNVTWIPPYPSTYGYGVGLTEISLTKKKSVPMVFHSGHIKGFSSFYARFPENRQAVIILSNTGGISTVRMNEVTVEVLKVLHGLPPTLPERNLADDLYQVIEQEGIAPAVTYYHRLRDAFPYEFKNSQAQLTALGQRLRQEGDLASAVVIFQLNSDVHPHWSTYYELAEACLLVGEPENAERYYQESLSLNSRKDASQKEAYRETKAQLKRLRQQTRKSMSER
jgi:CubicO group peptidase (beta-lactamase class C family)